MNRWKYFNPMTDALACKHCGEMHMNDEFMQLMDEMREKAGFPYHVTSGYRCSEHNQAVSSTGPRGPHTTGKALDIAAMDSWTRLRIVQIAIEHEIQRIGIAKTFIHLDTLTRAEGFPPGIWSY